MTDDDRQRAADLPAGDGESAAAPPAASAPVTDPGVANPAATMAPADAAVAGATVANAESPAAETAAMADAGAKAGDESKADAPAAKPKKRSTWLSDLKAIFWLLLAVLLFHSCVAKPFYIPSESMMPGLLKGDRLVVSKFPYGWSWVSPSFHIFPRWEGRIWGALPRRGDIVIATPPNSSSDYIKRVIGLPGDTIAVVDGQLFLNGQPVRRERRPDAMIPIDANVPCGLEGDDPSEVESRRFRWTAPDGRRYCRMPVFREYIPDGDSLRAYDTIDSGYSPSDDYPSCPPGARTCPTVYTVAPGHVFLMGDNRDDSADSRVQLSSQGLGGAVPWENIGGRAEFITFSLDGSSSYWNPISWFTALRGGRAGSSLHPTDGPANQGENRGQTQNQGQNQGAPRP